MHRSLLNIRNLFVQANKDMRDTIIYSLNGYKLVFGRGSYICCDGSVKFGADEATGAWQRVCIEASNHRKNVQYLEQLIMRVQELIGCAEIFINPFDSLTRNVEYMRSVIVRINSQPKLSRMELRRLFIGLVVEIIHPYGQLALLKNGRLQVPCNININELKSFISESEILKTARYNQQNLEEERLMLEELSRRVLEHLQLVNITWENNLELKPDSLLDSLQRLCEIIDSKAQSFAGLSLHISTNQQISIMPTGEISIPVNWK